MWMPALSRLDLHLASVLLLTLALTLSMYNNARASGTSLETIACTLATVSTAAASFASAMSRDAEALTTDEEVCKVDALQLVNQLMQGGAPSQTGSQACQATSAARCARLHCHRDMAVAPLRIHALAVRARSSSGTIKRSGLLNVIANENEVAHFRSCAPSASGFAMYTSRSVVDTRARMRAYASMFPCTHSLLGVRISGSRPRRPRLTARVPCLPKALDPLNRSCMMAHH